MSFFRRIAALFSRSSMDRDMDLEMRAHLERETEQNIARGMAPDAARSAARHAFGGRRELAIRVAVGAQPRALMRFVIHRGLKLVIAGIAVGLACSLALARLLQSVLFETSPLDPVTYIVVAAMMLLTGALACWLPARRAANVDPIQPLRAE